MNILIAVTTSSSNQKQESVKLFSKRHLTDFVSSSATETNQNILSSVKEKPVIFMTDKFKANLEKNSNLLEDFLLTFDKFLQSNAMKTVNVEENKIDEPEVKTSAKLRKREIEMQKEYELIAQRESAQQISLTKSLQSYINACISANMTDRAFAVLTSYRRRSAVGKYKIKLNTSGLYVDLMTKYAFDKNWNKVNCLFKILKTEKIPNSPNVYMTMLDCLGRMPASSDNSKLIESITELALKEVR